MKVWETLGEGDPETGGKGHGCGTGPHGKKKGLLDGPKRDQGKTATKVKSEGMAWGSRKRAGQKKGKKRKTGQTPRHLKNNSGRK